MPARCPAYGGRRPRHARQRAEGVVDLAELDPPTAELDLVVRAPDEQQPVLLELNQVPAAVGAVPAERRARREPLGVLGRVEVARQPHSADHQLADLTVARPATRPARPRRGPSRPGAGRCAPGPARPGGRAQATTVASVGP